MPPLSGSANKSNPTWTRDELILALDLYLERHQALPGKTSKEVIALSALLNRLAEKLGVGGGITYRNPNGVYMKLMNFRALDPEYTKDGRVGLTRLGQGDKDVWREFGEDAQRCRIVADAIRSAIASEGGEIGSEIHDLDGAYTEAEEGRLLTRLHTRRERNRKLVEAKKAQAMKKYGTLRCEACGFDFKEAYGERGHGFIECHHTKPVHTLTDGAKTELGDLALLCANCHRMIHVRRPWIEVGQLIKFIAHIQRG